MVIGLVFVRILLRTIGDDAYGVIAFLGSSVGLAGMLREIVQRSMVRELGEAYHSNDDQLYIHVFNSALVLTTVVSVFTLGLFAILLGVLHLMPVPTELFDAACWFIVFKGAQTFITIALTPLLNSYLLSERMIWHNVWIVMERFAWLLAAIGLLVFDITDPAKGIMFFGLWTCILMVASQLVACGVMIILDRRTLPKPWLARRSDIRSILKIGGWNTVVVTAMNMHERADALIMFLAFGPLGGRLFGFAVQLTSYTRMIAIGVTTGLDAVSTRFSTTLDHDALLRLTTQATRLHALVILPAISVIFILAEALLVVWVGDRLADPGREVPMAATLIRIMCLGMFARSMSDGWIAILYGAGHIRRYAPLILAGGILNPFAAVLLLLVLPEAVRYTGPALAFSGVLTITQIVLFPVLAARILEVSLGEVFSPMLRPLYATLLCLPLLLLPYHYIEQWDLPRLVMVLGMFSVSYVPATLFIVMNAEERRRLFGFVTRKLGLRSETDAQLK